MAANRLNNKNNGSNDFVTSVRYAMANDPGRMIFNAQVQKGFEWLDNYVDNILEAPEEPLLELVKTPGRKKDVPKKTRAAMAAAGKSKAITSLSFEDENSNTAPVNDFHQRLLHALDDEPHVKPSRQAGASSSNETVSKVQSSSKLKFVKIAHDMDLDDFIEVPDSSPEQSPQKLPAEETAPPPMALPAPAFPQHEAVLPQPDSIVELSMIAEDEEPAERSRMSVHLPPPSIPPSPGVERADTPTEGPSHEHWHSAHEDIQDDVEMTNYDLTQAFTVSDSTQHSSIAPRSPRMEPSVPEAMPEPIPAQHSSHEPARDAVADSLPSTSHHHHPEPRQEPPAVLPSSHHADTASTLFADSKEITMPLRDEDSAPTLARKRSMPQFAGLGVPSPLRKSIGSTLGTRTPGPPTGAGGGKRTSWLTKAREAKALEGTGKRTSTFTGGAAAGPSSMFTPAPTVAGVKRKSGDMLNETEGTADHNTPAQEERNPRPSKVAKVSDSGMRATPEHAVPVEKQKQVEGPPAPEREPTVSPAETAFKLPEPSTDTMVLDDFTFHVKNTKEGALDIFKKTISEARIGKGNGKSLGGNAVSELAQARAAAEARVAERHKVEAPEPAPMAEPSSSSSKPSAPPAPKPSPPPVEEPKISPLAPLQSFTAEPGSSSLFAPPPRTSVPSEEASRRLSVSELVSKNDIKPPQFKLPLSSVFSAAVPTAARTTKTRHSDSSTSTTPPNSPPHPRPAAKNVIPSGPVFTAPEPVFKAPEPKPKPNPYPFGGTAFTIGLQPQLPKHSNSPKPGAFYKESSQDSLFSDAVFDSQPSGSARPAWAPSTQDTEYTQPGSQSQGIPKMIFEQPLERDDIDEDPDDLNLNDDDDSWPLTEKLAAARQVWGAQEDSMTWSSVPTDSQNGDTRHMGFTQSLSQHREVEGEDGYEDQRVDAKVDNVQLEPAPLPVEEDMDVDVHEEFEEGAVMDDMEDDADGEDEELEDIVKKGKPTVQLVNPKNRNPGASTSSSDEGTSLGFFGNAGKFVSSIMGSKKGKNEPVKSIQLAAAAAKKQKEEQDKKATRMKEMEARRQAAVQKKAEEEKAKAEAEEKKIRDEAERRKKEREEQTGKRTLKAPEKKVTVEMEKKPTLKKPPSKDNKTEIPTRTTKPSPNPSSSLLKPGGFGKSLKKQTSTSTLNSQAGTSTAATATTATKGAKAGPTPAAKSKAKAEEPEPTPKPPAKIVRVNPRALLQEPETPPPPPMASELIDLPEPNSEYSDSDDEDRKKFDAPRWATSPEVRAQLEAQQTMNPDDIFGAGVRPLRMEEIFRTRHSRFRARTSSANWAGNDGVTEEENEEYARRMGYIREE